MVETIGERLRTARERAGLTLEQAAAEIGCTDQTVLNWEDGTHVPLRLYRRAVERFIRKHGKAARVRA